MINFKREYIGLEQDRLLYPVSFTDKAKCNVYGRKKFITEAGEVQLSAHVFLISKDFWTFNAGQLDFTNYPNGIWNDYISIDIIEKDEYTAPSINFGSMGDITPENLQGLSDYISKHLSDLEKRIVEDYLFIDEGVSENIELPNLPENHFWARRNGVIVGVNLDYLKADYEHLKNELWKNYESFNEKLQAALKKYYDDLELQMNNFFKDLIEKIREEAEKQLGLIAGAGGGLLHKIDQANHGFIFDPIVYENGVWKKATTTSGVDGMGVVISANTFFFLEAGEIEIPKGATDKDGQPLLDDEYYYMNEDGGTGFQKEEPVWFYQPLFHTRTHKGKLLANVHIDTMEDLRGQVVDTESGRTHGIALWGDIVPKFDTIEKLQKAFWLKEGEVVEVLGYYSAGDGAGHKRIIKVEDDGSGVQLSNKLWACIVHNGEINVSWFGAKGDGVTDDTEAIQKAIKKANVIILGEKTYRLTNVLEIFSNKNILGNRTTLYSEQQTKGIMSCGKFNGEYISNVKIDNIIFKNKQQGFNESGRVIIIHGAENVYISNCNIIGWDGDALIVDRNSNSPSTKNPNNIIIENCLFDGINKENRQAITLFAGENIIIRNNRFLNTTRNDMPGAIDLEPWLEPEEVFFKDIIIENNYFFNVKVAVNVALEKSNKNVSYLKGLCINNNIIEKVGNIAIYLYQRNQNNETFEEFEDWNSNDVVINNNTIIMDTSKPQSMSFWFMGMKNLTFSNNKIYGYNGMFYIGINNEYKNIMCKNINVFINDNIFTGFCTADSQAHAYFEIGINNNLNILNNTFIENKVGTHKTHRLFSFVNPTVNGEKVPYRYTQINKNVVYSIYDKKTNQAGIQWFGEMGNNRVGMENIKTEQNILTPNIIERWTSWDDKPPIEQQNNNITRLNTLYHMEKMKQEGVYEDYISYMDEKTLYDKHQRKLEQERQLAYEEALKENPELTYEEFMSLQPMTLNLMEEPQPSQALKDFMEKYL